jgi:sulfur relay (sulfurtransferase) complex TusBCD TusD component (DsrE family)
VVCYANSSDGALDDDIFVILVVSNLHDVDLCLCCADRRGFALRELCYKSMTMSPWGCEHQISTLPSAGASIWNVPATRI